MMTTPENQPPRICDYEGSAYQQDFWQRGGRQYEDAVERRALRRLLPARGRRLLEIGAGFGRITDEYAMYDEVVLLDYAFSHMQQARAHLGSAPRFTFVAADAYHLPFAAGAFDGVTVIRVIHHIADVDALLAQVRRVLVPGGLFILEFANKRNLKAIARYALGRQPWNPHTHEPVEFVELNYDFHPAYIAAALDRAGFMLNAHIPVSFLRIGPLKRTVPAALLAAADDVVGRTGALVSPSVFTRSRARGGAGDAPLTGTIEAGLFANPHTGTPLVREGEHMVCPHTGARWAIREGIYDFKAPV
jgi:ubiquinone/menaquinone biosynthesis C-methylase UbiE